MRNECNIIRDILPLYIDEIVSEDTISFVEEHLEKCTSCRIELEKMKAPNALESVVSDTQIIDEKPLKAFVKKWNQKKRIVISAFVTVLLLAVLLGSCFISYLKFDTVNPFSAVNGFVQVVVGGEDYVEIQDSPKVIIAQPNKELFIEYMESRGFTEVEIEEMGSLYYFGNSEGMEAVFYSQNAYFSKWTWEH